MVRFDVPRQLVQLHRHDPSTAVKLSQVRADLERKTGCQQGFPEQTAPFRSFSDDSKVRRIATREFATGKATKHPNFAGIYNLQYNNLNEGLDFWQWTYDYNGEDSSFLSRTGNRILNLDMKSTESYTFEDASLESAAEPFTVDGSKDLRFNWTASKNLLDLAYLSIFIGRSNYEKSIYCVFPAKDYKGSVPANLLSQLADGKHVVLAQLESTQIKPLTGWVISAYDWRSGRIEK